MRKIFGLILLASLVCSSSSAVDVAALVKQHGELRLGRTAPARGFEILVGHLRLELANGTASVVLAGEEEVGLFLHGAGTFTYVSENADELSAMRYNAKNSGVEGVKIAERGATVAGAFRTVLLRGSGLPAIDAEAAAEPPAEAFRENRTQFAREKYSEPAEHLLALQKANAPSARIVRADIDGAQRPFVYVYDEVWRRQESLSALRPPVARGPGALDWLSETPLSLQAVGRSNRTPAPQNVVITGLDVTLVNTSGDDASLTVVETLVPLRPLRAIVFDLYSDYIFDLHKTPRKYNVRRVVDGDGTELKFAHDRGSLLVGLAASAPANRPLKLRFEIDGDFLHRPEGSNYWELGIEPWFPTLAWSEHAFTYHAVVKVKKPFVAFTSGKTLRREVEGEWNVVETKLDQPVSHVAILAGRYHFDEESRNGVTVRVGSFLVKNETAWKKLQNVAFTAIETYPKFLGPFPFDEVNILERNDFGWGQAPAGIVFITKEAFTPMNAEANEHVKGINLRMAHEIAHMYWGNSVRVPSQQEQWIDEAFAEYSSAVLFRLLGRPEFYDQAFAAWRTGAEQATKVTSIPLANRLVNPGDPYGRAVTRQGLIYDKGAYLLAALHAELGDTQFLTFLKSYQRSFRGKLTTTADVMGLLQYMTKSDYGPFFEKYFYGTELPNVKKPK